MSEHTSGPWQVCNEYDCIGYEFEIRPLHYLTQINRYFGKPICKFTTNSDKQKDENKANARLIAAAPTLLIAAKSALVELTSDRDDNAIALLREAIRMAESGYLS